MRGGRCQKNFNDLGASFDLNNWILALIASFNDEIVDRNHSNK
jgi:hypothetical protein